MKIVRIGDDFFQSYWRTLWENSQYKYPLHTPLWGDFYEQQSTNSAIRDLSFIIVKDEDPLFLMLAVEQEDDENTPVLSWYGYPVITIEKKQLTKKEQSFIVKFLQDEILSSYNHKKLKLTYLDLIAGSRLSLMTEFLIQNNFKKKIVFTQMIDLKSTEKELTAGLRKSYKGEIKWGKNNLSIDVISADNLGSDSIDAFRKLHKIASGRETRSSITWDIMQQMVMEREAFCVFGYYLEELVSASFFSLSDNVCFYSVAASNRDMWDKPLSHALMWDAIIFAKQQGCEWFEMGEVRLSSDVAENSEQQEKELNISKFKAGFGGNKFIRIGIHN